MLRAIDQPYAAGVDMFLLRPWSINLSGRPIVPRPRRYSRPNRASRPSDAIYPSLLPGHQPVHPIPLSASRRPSLIERKPFGVRFQNFQPIKKKIDIACLPFLSLVATLLSLTHRRSYSVIRLPGHVSGGSLDETIRSRTNRRY